jgi:hypothetical protein
MLVTMAADVTFLYLGYAALLLAVVLLRLPGKMRAGFFAVVMLLAAIAGGQHHHVERVPTAVFAAAD